jgi:uncharacterized MAPEG superfamily protein
MSKLQALKNAAAQHSGGNPNQPRDGDGRFAAMGNQAKALAQTVAEKGAIAGAGALGHHIGGEAGAMAAMLGARTAIEVGKKLIEGHHAKFEQAVDDSADAVEAKGMGDIFGHLIAGAVKHSVGAAADAVLPHGGQAIGMAASAALTPHLVKAAKSLKGKIQQPSLQPRTA